MRETPVVPAFTLFALFFGVGSLANQSGLSLSDVLFTSIFMFAGPAQIALADQIIHNAPMMVAALSVAATGVRLFPMTFSLIPEVRDRSVPRWMEYVIAHFVGVTMWFETMRRVPSLPRHLRAWYTLGLSVYLLFASCVGAVLGFLIVSEMPRSVSAASLVISPVYFTLSLLGGVRKTEGYIPIVIGLLITPALHSIFPKTDLLISGVAGGSFAFWLMWCITTRRTQPQAHPGGRLTALSESRFFSQMRRIPAGVWIVSQLPWLFITVPPIVQHGLSGPGQLRETLIYVLVAICASLPLWVIWNTPSVSQGREDTPQQPDTAAAARQST